MLRNRFLAALGFGLVIGTVIAAPVSAATVIDPCSSTCGTYSVTDQSGGPYGATCKYETGSYDLDTIKVSPPKMYGPYSTKTKVEWKFNILRSKDFGGTWKGIYNSSWQAGMASTSTAASGFTSRTWTAPDPNPTGWFKVRILLWWVNPSGTGKMKIEYDHYQGKWNGTSDDRSGNDYCLQDW